MISMFLAAPTPPPGDDTPAALIDTAAILTFALQVVAPIIIAFLGLIFLTRSRQGQVSGVVTSSGIALVGLAFLGGASVLALLGDDIVNLVVK